MRKHDTVGIQEKKRSFNTSAPFLHFILDLSQKPCTVKRICRVAEWGLWRWKLSWKGYKTTFIMQYCVQKRTHLQPKANILSAIHLHLTQNAGRTRLQTDLPSSRRAAAKHSSQRNLPQRQSVKTLAFFAAFHLHADFQSFAKIVVCVFNPFCFPQTINTCV